MGGVIELTVANYTDTAISIDSYNFDDWIKAGSAASTYTRKNGGGSTISMPAGDQEGGGTGSFFMSWTGGTPTASGNTADYIFCSANFNSSNGQNFTIVADENPREVIIWGNGYSSTSGSPPPSNMLIMATLSEFPFDNDVDMSQVVPAGISQVNNVKITVRYKANSPSQTLKVWLAQQSYFDTTAGNLWRAAGWRYIGRVKYWNGSAWTAKMAKVWTGTAWKAGIVKRWNGSAWVVTNY